MICIDGRRCKDLKISWLWIWPITNSPCKTIIGKIICRFGRVDDNNFGDDDHESGSSVPVCVSFPGTLPTPSVLIFIALTWNNGSCGFRSCTNFERLQNMLINVRLRSFSKSLVESYLSLLYQRTFHKISGLSFQNDAEENQKFSLKQFIFKDWRKLLCVEKIEIFFFLIFRLLSSRSYKVFTSNTFKETLFYRVFKTFSKRFAKCF